MGRGQLYALAAVEHVGEGYSEEEYTWQFITYSLSSLRGRIFKIDPSKLRKSVDSQVFAYFLPVL